MLIPTTDKSLTQVSTVFDEGAAFEGIVVALAKAQAGASLGEKDISNMNKALRFLQQAKEGFTWIHSSSVTVTAQSRVCASHFATAAQSWVPKDGPSNFTQEIESMIGTTQELLNGTQLQNSNSVSLVREFFNRVFRSYIGQLDEFFSRPTLPRNLGW